MNLCGEPYVTVVPRVHLSLPDNLKAWAEKRVSEGRYSSTSDYLGDLVRRDQEAEDGRRRLQAAVELGRAAPVTSYSQSVIEDIIATSRSLA